MALLSVDTVTTNEGTILCVYEIGGKKPRRIYPPFQPYLYSLRPIQRGQAVKRKILSTMQEQVVWKRSFDSVEDLEQNRNAYTTEDNFPFKMRIAIDTGYKWKSNYPSMLSWDMETFTDGISPDWRKDRIRSIATWAEDEHKFFHGEEKAIILDFLAYVHQKDPDILCDFNGRFYDVPVLMQRCNALRINCGLGKDGSNPYIVKREFERRGKGRLEHTVLIRGRVHFDVDKETQDDYTLTIAGLKTRTLKEVARHYGLNPIEIDYSKMDSMSKKELEDYNLSDARCTYEIGQIYFRWMWQLAEYLQIPVDMIVRRQPSHVGNIVLGRQFHQRGIISNGANKDRFPQLMSGKKANQGAFGKCYRFGVFTSEDDLKVIHKDFVSMYVNILRATNASPENTRLVSVKPYTGQYNFAIKNGIATIEIAEYPKRLGDFESRQVTMHVDQSCDSVLRSVLDDIVAKRNEAKKLWKETNMPEYESRQNALKLVGNSLWGYNSLVFSKYGSVLVGIIDTGVGRYLIQNAAKWEETAGNQLLQIATDGIWMLEKSHAEFDVNAFLPKEFKTEYLTMESEEYEGLIVIDEKNHIYRDKKGKTVKHGSTILGRSIPRVVDRFIDELADALFKKTDPIDVLRSWSKRRVSTYPTKDFVSYKTLSKRPDQYHSTTMYAHLIKTLKNAGISARYGERINYVKTKTYGYVPTPLLKDFMAIDYDYYVSYMCGIAEKILKKPAKELKNHFDQNVRLSKWQ